MLNHITVTFEGDHVLVLTDGDKDYEYLEQLWSKVSRECERHQCFNVLGVANTNTPVEAVEAYELPRIFREYGIDNRYRIAWVELSEHAVDMIAFIASILSNRDLPGRQFATVEEARRWLLDEPTTGRAEEP